MVNDQKINSYVMKVFRRDESCKFAFVLIRNHSLPSILIVVIKYLYEYLSTSKTLITDMRFQCENDRFVEP